MTAVRIGIGQINTRVGDFAGNAAKIRDWIREAGRQGVELLVFPEMAAVGYPVEDLAFRGSFMHSAKLAIEEIASSLGRSRMAVVVGGIEIGDEFFNAAAVIHRGRILGWARKRYLFCCGRVVEERYFSPGQRPLLIQTENFRAAVTLGEDFGYPLFPAEIELLVNLWNEPYRSGRRPLRERMMIERAREDAVAMVMVNSVGAQDDLVFEGSSMVVDGFGEVLARGKAFAEDLVIADLDLGELKAHRSRTLHTSRPMPAHLARADQVQIPGSWPVKKRPVKAPARKEPMFKGPHEVFAALVMATRDFVQKCGLERVVVGVSGGIDSALVLTLARESMGKTGVIAVSMPGPYTSEATRKDARIVAANLGVKFYELPIRPIFQAFQKGLAPAFTGLNPDVTEENLQARIRGQILMSLANKFKALVLTTGNKSEAAAGYCTLFGDTSGGFAPLIDVYKTKVYELAEWFNHRSEKEIIPAGILERPPTAELRPGQTDQDTLPPYLDLDRILHGLLEERLSISELVEKGEGLETVHQVIAMLMASEFKRRLSPVGPTISDAPLSELRLPIAKKTGWWEEGKGEAPAPRKPPHYSSSGRDAGTPPGGKTK